MSQGFFAWAHEQEAKLTPFSKRSRRTFYKANHSDSKKLWSSSLRYSSSMNSMHHWDKHNLFYFAKRIFISFRSTHREKRNSACFPFRTGGISTKQLTTSPCIVCRWNIICWIKILTLLCHRQVHTFREYGTLFYLSHRTTQKQKDSSPSVCSI
jgi:hypothetical protein